MNIYKNTSIEEIADDGALLETGSQRRITYAGFFKGNDGRCALSIHSASSQGQPKRPIELIGAENYVPFMVEMGAEIEEDLVGMVVTAFPGERPTLIDGISPTLRLPEKEEEDSTVSIYTSKEIESHSKDDPFLKRAETYEVSDARFVRPGSGKRVSLELIFGGTEDLYINLVGAEQFVPFMAEIGVEHPGQIVGKELLGFRGKKSGSMLGIFPKQ